jgi:hypothetical protein
MSCIQREYVSIIWICIQSSSVVIIIHFFIIIDTNGMKGRSTVGVYFAIIYFVHINLHFAQTRR